MEESEQILIIEDDQELRHDLSTIFQFMGYRTVAVCAAYWEDTISSQAPEEFCALFLGDFFQAESSLHGMLSRIQNWCGGVPVVQIDGQVSDNLPASLDRQIIARLEWPCSKHQLLSSLHYSQVYREQWKRAHQVGHQQVQIFRGLVGKSERIRKVRSAISQVADKDVNVLITGESGTGKEVVAKNIHEYSNRRDAPFVPINCGAIPADFLESEMFGHEEGSFTGAVATRKGRFELAEGGTIFLDEIGDMPLHMQVKLLRVLEEKTFERIGGSEKIKANIRIIAATHKNFESMIAEGSFREDLYYQLNVFPIEMPSLKERPEDIPLIINELTHSMEKQGRGSIRLSTASTASLCRHGWSGNIREMANLLERLAILFPYGVIGVQDLPNNFCHIDMVDQEKGVVGDIFQENIQPISSANVDDLAVLPVGGLNLKDYLTRLEKSLIKQALSDCNNVVARAADKLQLRRTTLVEKMRKYGLHRYDESVKS